MSLLALYVTLVIASAASDTLKRSHNFRAVARQSAEHFSRDETIVSNQSSTPSVPPMSDITNRFRGSLVNDMLSSIGKHVWPGASSDQSEACVWSKKLSQAETQRHAERSARVAKWVAEDGTYAWQKTCKQRPDIDYAWRSCSGTSVRALNAEEMCTILRNRGVTSILFVGDSLTRLSAYTAAALLDAEQGEWSFGGGNPEKDAVNMRKTACNGGVRVGFLRNDLLDISRTDAKCPRGGDYCLPWANSERFGDFDVVVVNSGAHFVDDVTYAKLMTAASDRIKSLVSPKQRIIFRATVPGHSNCTEATQPFNNLAEAEVDIAANPWFDGAHFQKHNDIARREFQRNGFEYMDVYTPTVQRRDMHVGKSTNGKQDCLHYCLPGPSLLWVDFLLHMIDGGSEESLP